MLKKFENSNYLKHLPQFARHCRLKQWHYWSLSTPDFFIGQAQIQLGYVAKMFFYLYHHQLKTCTQVTKLSPLGRNLKITPELTLWNDKRQKIEIRDDTQFSFQIDHSNINIVGDLKLNPHTGINDSFEMLHQFDSRKPEQLAYTKKNALYNASGSIQINKIDYAIEKNNSFAVTDWTKSWAKRITRWKWASFSGRDKTNNHRIGLNLSTHVYENEKGEGQENVLWIDDRRYILQHAKIEPHAKDNEQRDLWHIQAKLDETDPITQNKVTVAVDLKMRSVGERKEYENYGIVMANFTQPFGFYSGTINVNSNIFTIDDVFGVVEDHFAKW